MLSQLFLPWRAADSWIMSYCRRAALLIFHSALPNILDAPWTLISRMWQQAFALPFWLSRWPIHSHWNDVTIQPIDCRLCETKHRWQSVDDQINHIKTAYVHWIIVCNQSYSQYWHPPLHLCVLSFASRSFVTSQFLINWYPRYLRERWHGPITFPRFRPAIYACRSYWYFLVNLAVLDPVSLSSSFSSTSMTSHEEFNISQPCARGLCGLLCSWEHR